VYVVRVNARATHERQDPFAELLRTVGSCARDRFELRLLAAPILDVLPHAVHHGSVHPVSVCAGASQALV
jgi:hypothetical protein